MALTKDQQRALALAKARRARAEAEKPKAPDDFQQYVPEPAEVDVLSPLQYAARQGEALLRGATLGGLDELQGLVAGGVNVAMGKDFESGYESATEKSRQRAEDFRDIAPVTAYGSEIAGSIVPSLALAPLAGGSRAAQAALAATEGGVAGALSAEGDASDRLLGAGMGTALGGLLGGGAALLPKKKDVAKILKDEDIYLTPGQQVGSLPGMIENLLSRTVAGNIIGIEKAQQKTYETFSKSFIEKSLRGIDYKVPKGMGVRDALDDADSFTKKFFKEAAEKASLNKETVDALETSVLSKIDDPEYLLKIGLDEDQASEALSILDSLVFNKTKKGTLTGKELADSLSSLGSRANKLVASTGSEADDRNLGFFLFDIQSEILGSLPDNVGGANLKKARDAYKSMVAVKKASKGKARDAFTPAQAESALETVFKEKAKETPQGLLARQAKQVAPAASVAATQGQKDFGSVFSLGQLIALGSGGLAALPGVAAGLAGGASAYRGGQLGSDIATGILQTPGSLLSYPAKAPALSGLLAETITEDQRQ